MKTTDVRSRKSLLSFGVAALLALGAASAQVATAASGQPDSTGNYQHEVQSCLSGNTQQDQATCLREARNAAAEKRRGLLPTMGDLQANASARCDVFKTDIDKAACEARLNSGNTEGSVAGGGVLREAEITIPPSQVMGNR